MTAPRRLEDHKFKTNLGYTVSLSYQANQLNKQKLCYLMTLIQTKQNKTKQKTHKVMAIWSGHYLECFTVH